MPDLSSLIVFLTISIFLLIAPGSIIALIIARSLTEGMRVTLPLVLGVAFGGLTAATLAFAGASTLLMSSAMAISVAKWIGAAYLTFLGIKKMLIEKSKPFDQLGDVRTRTSRRAFRDRFIVTVFNPKELRSLQLLCRSLSNQK